MNKKIKKTSHMNMYNRFPLTLVRGDGVRLYDDDNKEYIDALAGIAVCTLGHAHPKVSAAICQQSEKLMHVSNLFYNEPQNKLADLLTSVSGMNSVFFCNSGAEAMEGAVKLLRKHGKAKKKGKIISMENCFHGRTLATIAMGKRKYQEGFDPMPEGFMQVPFNDEKALEDAVDENTIGIVVEPVQGEGGIYPADDSFLKKARELCDKYDALLVFDEIQCGLGLTGYLFAWEKSGVKPDIITLSKALGNGFPIGAVLTGNNLKNEFAPGEHGTTFGGNPLACSAGYATVKAIIDEGLVTAADEKGLYFIDKLKELSQKHDKIISVRGRGLMIGVELDCSVKAVVQSMMRQGVIVGTAGENIIRIVPPLIISIDEIDIVIATFEKSLMEEICE